MLVAETIIFCCTGYMYIGLLVESGNVLWMCSSVWLCKQKSRAVILLSFHTPLGTAYVIIHRKRTWFLFILSERGSQIRPRKTCLYCHSSWWEGQILKHFAENCKKKKKKQQHGRMQVQKSLVLRQIKTSWNLKREGMDSITTDIWKTTPEHTSTT